MSRSATDVGAVTSVMRVSGMVSSMTRKPPSTRATTPALPLTYATCALWANCVNVAA